MPKKKSELPDKKTALKKRETLKPRQGKPSTRVPGKRGLRTSLEGRSADIFQAVFNLNPIATAVSTVDEGRFIWINRAFLEFSGYSEKEVLSRTAHELKIWASPEERKLVISKLVADGQVRNHEVMLCDKSGSMRNCLFSAHFITLNSEKYLLTMAVDITGRVSAEEDLKKTREEYRLMVENSPIGFFKTSPPGKFTMVNPAMARMFGFDSVDEFHDFVKDVAIQIYYNAEDQKRFLSLLHNERRVMGEEFLCRKKNGDPFWVLASCRAIMNEKNEMVAIEGFFNDISDLKRAEENLRSSREDLTAMLKEKEILLREIHHRVRNNMQIISSLMSLQAAHAEDPRARQLFEASQGRVRSMALVHEKLYQSRSIAGLDVREFVTDLLKEITSIYSFQERIDITINMDNMAVAIDDMVPLSLIIYELVSNAYKHAFPGNTRGSITIDCYREGQDNVLKIRDNGTGLPSGFNYQTSDTLGLQLVNALVAQIHGSMAMESGDGTLFTIRFAMH